MGKWEMKKVKLGSLPAYRLARRLGSDEAEKLIPEMMVESETLDFLPEKTRLVHLELCS
jgi:hypothetical protein